MQIIRDTQHWKKFRSQIAKGKTIGFVPTMGCLHQGHLSLIEESINENDITIISIFVNPTQFNVKEDYDNYPITEQTDLKLATEAGVDAVFIPDKKQLYPDDYHFKIVTTHPMSKAMEGEHRPGHFNGMLTIVMKLLLLIAPTKAYFGEKDFQQLWLIKQLVKSFFMNIEIVTCPTRRTPSGLPFSSRNNRLSESEKQLAEQAFETIHSSTSTRMIEAKLKKMGIDIDYIKKYNDRLFVAFKIGNVRMVDNILLH